MSAGTSVLLTALFVSLSPVYQRGLLFYSPFSSSVFRQFTSGGFCSTHRFLRQSFASLSAGASVLLAVLFVCRQFISGGFCSTRRSLRLSPVYQRGLLFCSPFSSSVASLSAGTSIHCSLSLSPVYLPGPVFANVRSFDLGRTPHQKCFSCLGGSCCFSLGSNSLQDGRHSGALRPAHSTACCAGQTVMLTYRDCAGQTVMLTYRDCA